MANLEKLDTKIQREESKLQALTLRKAEILKDIARTEKTIADLKSERKAAELGGLGAIAENMGITISELVDAMKTGNFYDLQEKIENSVKNAETSDEADTDNNGGYDYSSEENTGGMNES